MTYISDKPPFDPTKLTLGEWYNVPMPNAKHDRNPIIGKVVSNTNGTITVQYPISPAKSMTP